MFLFFQELPVCLEKITEAAQLEEGQTYLFTLNENWSHYIPVGRHNRWTRQEMQPQTILWESPLL